MPNNTQGSNLRRFMKPKPVKVLSVCSGKGGVGKTNVACNVAIALGSRGRNTCLLDADLSLANVDVLLGLQPRFNLSHVVSGDADLTSTILDGPSNIRIVPASSGNFCMTDLPPAAQVGIIQAFSELTNQPEVLVVDTAAGISSKVAQFVQAGQHPLVVVCDEPAALTDAYALIKVFSQNYGISRFQIVTNQSRKAQDGRALFRKLSRVTDSYLDVVLRHLGDIPRDDYLVKAVQEQRAVVDAYPKSESGVAFQQIAASIDALPAAREASGGIEFFLERLLMANPASRGKVA
ncbi:MAG: MinD/ParA family protein [Gammaproteobacteria bacterium]|nr:MinD/ParA family protein [Gammaproteobacteria bacterium]